MSALNESMRGNVPSGPDGEGWSSPVQVAVGAFVASVTALTLLGNVSVVYAFARCSRLRTHNNYFVVSLAVADLIVGLTSMPLYGLYWVLGYWPLGHSLCSYHLVVSHCILNTTFLGVLAIAVDRFMSVTYPILHLEYRTKRLTLAIVALTYILPLAIWLPFLLFWEFVYDGPFFVQDYRCYPLYLSNIVYTAAAVLLLNWLPICSVTLTYARVYRAVRGKIARRRARLRALRSSVPRHVNAGAGGMVEEEDASPESAISARMVPMVSRRHAACRQSQSSGEALSARFGSLCGAPMASESRSSSEVDYRPSPSGSAGSKEASLASATCRPVLVQGCPNAICNHQQHNRDALGYVVSPGTRRSTAYARRVESNLALRTLSLIFISMLISGLPWAITAVVIVICRYCIPFFVQQMLVFLVHTSSAINPFCYAAANPLYRMAFLHVLNLKCYAGTIERPHQAGRYHRT